MAKADPKAHYHAKLGDPRERAARVKARATEVLQAKSPSGSLIEHLPAARDLADVVSLSELSLRRLRAVFRIISHFTEAADAMCCQPRCEVAQGELNDVGKFVEWHAELWGRLADRLIEEASNRIPADQDEAEDRLKILMERALIDCEYSFLAEAVHGLRMMAS